MKQVVTTLSFAAVAGNQHLLAHKKVEQSLVCHHTLHAYRLVQSRCQSTQVVGQQIMLTLNAIQVIRNRMGLITNQ